LSERSRGSREALKIASGKAKPRGCQAQIGAKVGGLNAPWSQSFPGAVGGMGGAHKLVGERCWCTMAPRASLPRSREWHFQARRLPPGRKTALASTGWMHSHTLRRARALKTHAGEHEHAFSPPPGSRATLAREPGCSARRGESGASVSRKRGLHMRLRRASSHTCAQTPRVASKVCFSLLSENPGDTC
jgi:hypothetical protein